MRTQARETSSLRAVVVISSDDDDDITIPSTPRKAVKSSRERLPSRQINTSQVPHVMTQAIVAERTRKPATLNFMKPTTGLSSTPGGKAPAPLGRVVSVSSSESEDEGAPTPPVYTTEPLLYSPVKTSHDRDVIDLTLSSDEDDVRSGSSDDDGKVISLLEESPPPSPVPRLKRLIKGSRFPTYHSEDELIPDQLTGSRITSGTPSRAILPDNNAPESADNLDDGCVDKIPGSLPDEDSKQHEVVPKQSKLRPKTKLHKPRNRTPSPEPDAPLPSRPQQTLPITSLSKKGKTPRVSKKALQAAEQARREAYAQKLFSELNQSVFKGGLPESTALKWSNRLLTTAGRARWRKSRDGSQTTEIELATKILDCDERIRNTLSHEMHVCHLACWIINGDPKEGHGRIFKAWAAKVSRKRPEIVVSTRHNYEINYPYEWECDNCAKVYGRYSKSIRPDECLCGTCKVGKLVPLFTTRTAKTPAKTKTVSQMAATKLDTPRIISALTHSLSDLTIGDDTENSAQEYSQNKTASRTGSVGRIDAQLVSLTQELGGIDLAH